MEIAIDTFEDLAYGEKGDDLCKPVKCRQNVSIEIDVIDIDDIREIKCMMKQLGYEKTFSGTTPSEKYLMEFERK
jgi:hypothetical protein